MDQLEKKIIETIIKDNCPLFNSLARMAASGEPKKTAMNIIAKMQTPFSRNAWSLVVDYLYSKEGTALLEKAVASQSKAE